MVSVPGSPVHGLAAFGSGGAKVWVALWNVWVMLTAPAPLAWAGAASSNTTPSTVKLEMSLFIGPPPILQRRERGSARWMAHPIRRMAEVNSSFVQPVVWTFA